MSTPRILLVEDNLEEAGTIVAAFPDAEITYAPTGLDAMMALLWSEHPFAAVLLDMNLPGWTEWPWLEPLRWLPRHLRVEGSCVLKLVTDLREGPNVVVAISGIPENNAWFMQNGATHDAGGKDPAKIRACLEDAKILGGANG